MVFEGENIDVPIENEINEEKLEHDNQHQIFDITNVIGAHFHLGLLKKMKRHLLSS